MSVRVGVAGRAEADLTHQYRWYLDNASGAIAERFLAAFDATVARLAKQPELGARGAFVRRNSPASGPSPLGAVSASIWFSIALRQRSCPSSV